jgi:2-amino-4-hydroxy-6-hydroxymethyldihydropteridine diphosphokinase
MANSAKESAIKSAAESVKESAVDSAMRRYDRAMNHSSIQHALVALGSNLDAPATQLKRAILHLQRHSEGTFVCSSIYRTPPHAMPAGTPDFANAVVRLETTQSGPELLSFLNSLEVFFGRPANHEKNVSRVLDLDLIALGEVISQSEALTLPHPRAAQRDFVLQPIVEIWPDYRLPGFEATASELLAQLGSSPLQYWDTSDY